METLTALGGDGNSPGGYGLCGKRLKLTFPAVLGQIRATALRGSTKRKWRTKRGGEEEKYITKGTSRKENTNKQIARCSFGERETPQ